MRKFRIIKHGDYWYVETRFLFFGWKPYIKDLSDGTAFPFSTLEGATAVFRDKQPAWWRVQIVQ